MEKTGCSAECRCEPDPGECNSPMDEKCLKSFSPPEKTRFSDDDWKKNPCFEGARKSQCLIQFQKKYDATLKKERDKKRDEWVKKEFEVKLNKEKCAVLKKTKKKTNCD